MEKIKDLPADRISREDTATLLGVSSKAVDRYTKPGKTKPAKLTSKQTSQRESGGFITHFDRKEVETLKLQMESGETEGQQDSGTQALARRSDKTLANTRRDIKTRGHGDSGTVIELPAELLRELLTRQTPAVPIKDKASISIEEAIELSGMNKAAIMRGVEAGSIKHDLNGPRGSIRLSTVDVIKFASAF